MNLTKYAVRDARRSKLPPFKMIEGSRRWRGPRGLSGTDKQLARLAWDRARNG